MRDPDSETLRILLMIQIDLYRTAQQVQERIEEYRKQVTDSRALTQLASDVTDELANLQRSVNHAQLLRTVVREAKND